MGEPKPDRPLFVGNFEYGCEERDVVRLFDRFGRVDRIDMKMGFAFIYMADRRDAEDAIRKLDDTEFGNKRRRLKVQWAKLSEADRKRDTKPSLTLFVVNFDVQRVRERDLERYFDYYGPIKRVQIKKTYAFVQFESMKDAIKALDGTNGKQFMGRTITVEFVQHENVWNKEGGSRSPARKRSRSPSYDRPKPRARSRSPVPRRSPSPQPRRSPSPVRRRSPSPVRRRSLSPVRRRSPSPAPRRSPSPARRRSPSPVRRRSPSPVRRRSLSPRRSPSPARQRSPSPRRRSPSPAAARRSPSPAPVRRSPSPGPRRSPSPRRFSRSRSRSPLR